MTRACGAELVTRICATRPGGNPVGVHSTGAPWQGEPGEPPQSTESKQSDPEFLFVIGFVLCVVGYFFFFSFK